MYDKFVNFYNNYFKNYINNKLLLDDSVKIFDIISVHDY